MTGKEFHLRCDLHKITLFTELQLERVCQPCSFFFILFFRLESRLISLFRESRHYIFPLFAMLVQI